MKHGYYIGKIGLVIGDKQYIGIGQLRDNFRAFNLQLIHATITGMGKKPKDKNEPLFDKQDMSERISFENSHIFLINVGQI
jgi:hypothetical protein